METLEEVRLGAKIITESAGVRVLDEVTVLEVTGDDSRSWLNGQVTNDVRETKSGDAVYALAVSVKGRVLADVWVLDRGEEVFWLAVPKPSVGPLLESFETQIIMEDVEVAAREDLVVISVVGPSTAEVVTAAAVPKDRLHPADRLGVGGVDVIVTRASFEATRSALVEAARRAEGDAICSESWDLVRLWKRTPRFAVDFDDRNYPQEAGLEARAVSFNKGCYLGQEVVCMLENRGKVSRRLVVLSIDGTSAVEAGADIETSEQPEQNPGQNIGHITSACIDGASALAFGYVKSAFAAAGADLDVNGRPATIVAVVE